MDKPNNTQWDGLTGLATARGRLPLPIASHKQ